MVLFQTGCELSALTEANENCLSVDNEHAQAKAGIHVCLEISTMELC